MQVIKIMIKFQRMMVDEADIDLVGGGGGNNRVGTKRLMNPLAPGEMPMGPLGVRNPLKRKPGPLPPHFTARRPSSTSPVSPLISPLITNPVSEMPSGVYGRPPEPMNMWGHQTNGDLNLPSIDTGPSLELGANNVFSQVATYQPQSPASMGTPVKPLMNGGNI